MHNEYLANTYYQIKTADTLNVAYFGGSVTCGHGSSTRAYCWRSLTTKWLETTYGVTVNEVNGAIGGTGSIYGAHRVVRDLKLETVKPHLVFLEFAINDHGERVTNPTPGAYLESIIRTIRSYAPQADIVAVFLTSYGDKGDDFPALLEHREVAERYHIPYISAGKRLWKQILSDMAEDGVTVIPNAYKENAQWLRYVIDSAHPNDAGYALYASYVREALLQWLPTDISLRALPDGSVDVPMPAQPLHTLPTAPHLDNLYAERAHAPSGISVLEARNGMYAVPAGAFAFTQIGAKVTVTFRGSDLQLWIKNAGPAVGQTATLRLTVDGVRQQPITNFGATNHKLITLASGLQGGVCHTVTVEMENITSGSFRTADMAQTDPCIDNVYVCDFLIRGDDTKSGITMVY